MKRRTAFGFRGWYRGMLTKSDLRLIHALEQIRPVKGGNYVAFAVDTKELPHIQQLAEAYSQYVRKVCGEYFDICIYAESAVAKRDNAYMENYASEGYAFDSLPYVFPGNYQCAGGGHGVRRGPP